MAGKSNIEWTEMTWNPIVGCSIVSPGCTNCYAMKMAGRIEAMGNQPRYAGTTRKVNGNAIWTGKMAQAGRQALLAPLKRKKPTRYFVNSMSDLFHESVPDEWIDQVFAVMAIAEHHTFQILTKRSRRMRDYFAKTEPVPSITNVLAEMVTLEGGAVWVPKWPLPNVWLGVSTERQQEADARIPDLLQTPAAIRFISAEPLLGPIDLTRIMRRDQRDDWVYCDNALTGFLSHKNGGTFGDKLDWVIVGGESGAGARPMYPEWARSLRDQCAGAEVPYFFKQWGQFIVQGQVNPDYAYDLDCALQNGRASNDYLNGKPVRVGKARAGRRLDGIEHDGMPEVSA